MRRLRGQARAGRLLLYLASADDPQRAAVAPTLAAAAARAGWWFDLYYDALRRGRHYGGNEWNSARPGQSAGGLVAGGGHAEQAIRLCLHYDVAVVGDPESVLWPALEEAGAEEVARSRATAELYAAVFDLLELAVPERALVLDAQPQGERGLVVAPFLYPAILSSPPVVGVEAGGDAGLRERLEELGVRRFDSVGVDPDRAAAFPGGLDEQDTIEAESYAALSARIAASHRGWGEGVLLGDPDLIAAQLPKAARLKLLPLYGRPQVDAIEAADVALRAARDPVYGRQYDDRDLFALAERGVSLDIVDPAPPFDATVGLPPAIASPSAPPGDEEPDDTLLGQWAEEGRVLATVVLWSGMTRETDSLPRLLDLIAETGLRAGLAITLSTLENAPRSLELVAVRPEHGGVGGLVEMLLGSTGRGVGPEAYFPPGRFAPLLAGAADAARQAIGPELHPRGWWPLLDARLRPRRDFPVSRPGRVPVIRYARRDQPTAVQRALGSLRLEPFSDPWRPFDHQRPGTIDAGVVRAVRDAGFEYMWTKTGFGSPTVVERQGDFVAIPFTAGNWDGWSPFFTIGSHHDVRRAERRLLRSGRPGWLASTIDGVLWALSGEVWARGAQLHRALSLIAQGGQSGRLINVTPRVVARYARLLDDLDRGA
jgi:hypothetical protein